MNSYLSVYSKLWRLLFIFVAIFFCSCTKSAFDGLFDVLTKDVPIKKTEYVFDGMIKKDTLYKWSDPYRLYVQTFMQTDSSAIYTEEPDLERLRDMLWYKWDEWKKAKKEKKAEKNLP